MGRLTVIPYYPLTDDALAEIIRLKLDKITGRIRDNYDVPCVIDPEVIELILSRCHEVDSGARNTDAIISHTLLPQLAGELLAHDDSQSVLKEINVFVNEEDNFAYRLDCDPIVALNQMAQCSESETNTKVNTHEEEAESRVPASQNKDKQIMAKASTKNPSRKKPTKEASL